ncbi:MAG: hypothetical protein U0610_04790 [bacterium]
MRRCTICWVLAAVALWSSAATAQTAAPTAAASDPARRLAQSLAAQARAYLEGRGEPVPLVVVAPVREASGAFAGAAKRVRTALLLEMAKLSSLRVTPGELDSAPEGAWVLATALDVTRETVVLTGRLRPRLGEAPAEPDLLAALPSVDTTIAALTQSSGMPGRLRVELSSLGTIAGPVLAAAAVPAPEAGSDRLAVVTDGATRVLAVMDGAVTEVAAITHVRGDASNTPPRSRDPRAGLVVSSRDGEPVQLWVQPPSSAGYTWTIGTSLAAVARRHGEIPLAPRVGGGAWVAPVRDGTNVLASVASVRGPLDTSRAVPLVEGPFLEVAVHGDWLAFEEPSGAVALASAPRVSERVAVGRFGSALAPFTRLDEEGAWLIGDRDDGATLVLARITGGEASEAWSGPAPFRVCGVVTGRFSSSDAPSVVAVGCGERAPLATLRIEDAP